MLIRNLPLKIALILLIALAFSLAVVPTVGATELVEESGPTSTTAQSSDSVTLRVKANGTYLIQGALVYVKHTDRVERIWNASSTSSYDGQDILLTISGLDWTTNSVYSVFIPTDYALFSTNITQGMVGKETVVDVDTTYVPLQLTLPFTPDTNTDSLSIILTQVLPGNYHVAAGRVNQGTLVPPAIYNVQIVVQGHKAYCLYRVNCSLQTATDAVAFTTDEIVTLTATPSLPAGVTVSTIFSYHAPAQSGATSTSGVVWVPNHDGSYSCNVNIGTYESLHLHYELAAVDETWTCSSIMWEPFFNGNQLFAHDLQSLQGRISLSSTNLHVGQTLSYRRDFGIVDAVGNKWNLCRQNPWHELEGTVSLLDPNNSNSVVFTSGFIDGEVTMPNLLGTHILQYEVTGAPFSIGVASQEIQLGETPSATISGTITLPDQQAAVTDMLLKISATDWAGLGVDAVIPMLAGQTSVTYSLDLPDIDNHYQLRYEILSGGDGYYASGYVSSTGLTTNHPDGAQWIVPGSIVNFTLAPLHAQGDAIRFQLVGTGLGVPKIRISYPRYHAGVLHYYGSIWEDDLQVHKEVVPDGWLISTSNFLDFTLTDRYIVAFSTGNALFTCEITEATDLTQPVVLTTEGHVPLQVALPFTYSNPPFVRLNHLYGTNAWYAGDVRPGALVPAATYNVQIAIWEPAAEYCLFRTNYQHSVGNNTIAFDASEIVPLSITLPQTTLEPWVYTFCWPQDAAYGTMYSGSWRPSGTGYYQLNVSTGNYSTFEVNVSVSGWNYELNQDTVLVNGPIDYGTLALQARANLNKQTFAPGESIHFTPDQFGVFDAAQRKWQVRDATGEDAYGRLELIATDNTSTFIEFVDSKAALPAMSGSYQLVYHVPGSPLAIQPSQPVTITLDSNIMTSISGQVTLPVGQSASTGGLSVQITALAEDKTFLAETTATILENQSTGEFSLDLPADTSSCRLMYSIVKGDGRHIQQGYYRALAGSTPTWTSSSSVSVPATSINIAIPEATTYNDQIRIRLPIGNTRPNLRLYSKEPASTWYRSEYAYTSNADQLIEGWNVGISGLVFDSNRPQYTVVLNAGSALYTAQATAANVGQVIVLSEDSLVPFNIQVPFAIDPNSHTSIGLHLVDQAGGYYYGGSISPDTLVPTGTYNTVLRIEGPSQAHALHKANVIVDQLTHTLAFTADELAQISVDLAMPEGVSLDEVECLLYLPTGYRMMSFTPLIKDTAGLYNIQVAKNEYRELRVVLHVSGWRLHAVLAPFSATANQIPVTITPSLQGNLDLKRTVFAAGERLDYWDNFGVRDADGNRWDLYDNEYEDRRGSVIITGDNDYRVELPFGTSSSVYLPSDLPAGTYTLTYQADCVPIPIAPVSTTITVTDAAEELREVHVTGAYWLSDPALPTWVPDPDPTTGRYIAVTIGEWIAAQDYNQLSTFLDKAGRTFIFKAEGHPDVLATAGGSLSTGDGSFQAFNLYLTPSELLKMVSGVSYTVHPVNTNETYFWTVMPGVTLTRPTPSVLLSDILIGGVPLVSFEPAVTAYNAVVPPGSFALETVSVDSTCTVTVTRTNTDAGSGQIVIVVTTPDGQQSQTYTINFTVQWPSGDVNGDDFADINDLAAVAWAYGLSSEAGVGFAPELDLNKDMIIDLFDLVIMARCINPMQQ